jgi:regulator of sigma E protease
VSYFLAFAGIATLVILHEFGHFVMAKWTGMRVERFSLFFPPLLVRKKLGETEYAIGALPLGGYVKISGMSPEEDLPPDVAPRAYYNQPVWKRVVVILAGPVMNLLVAFFILFGLAFGAQKVIAVVDQVRPGTPAATALRPGDRILSVDGRHGDPADYQKRIGDHKCAGKQVDGCRAAVPATLVVRRDGQIETILVRPRYNAADDRMQIGFFYGSQPLNPSVPKAASTAGTFMWEVTKATLGVFGRIFESEQRKQVGSIVGGYEVTRQSFSQDLRRALTLLAFLSLSLAILNLFPFLPLDGGHVFWSLVEKVRGERVPYRVIAQASAIGIMLVVFLFVVGVTNDINRLSGGGFDQR